MGGIQRAYKKDENEMTLAVLNLTAALVKSGIYDTEAELLQVLEPLLLLLNGSSDFNTSKEETMQ